MSFFYTTFMFDIIMQLDILVILTYQVTTIICHYTKSIIKNKKETQKKYKQLDQNSYINKNGT